MSSSHEFQDPHSGDDEEAAMLDPNEALEEIPDDPDAAMDSGDDDGQDEDMQDTEQEIQLQNDSSAHFDHHKDSIFTIAQHPLKSSIVATGGSEGDDAGGMGYVFDSTPDGPVLPPSYASAPQGERKSLDAIARLEGHTDSINALTFTLPNGEFLLSGGLDGKLRAYSEKTKWGFVVEAQEVEEINWLQPCPNPASPNTIALGANDGSVWVYTVEGTELQIVQSYFLHTESCTAGSWSADGKLLATVSEEGSLYVWDVFGSFPEGTPYVVGLTALDQRFAVEGGLFSVAIAPKGEFVVVGGAGGSIKVVGLPRLSSDAPAATSGRASTKTNKSSKGSKPSGSNAASVGQAGQILADLQAQGDGIETLAFSAPPLTLLAAGSVDGSIALFDSAHRWAVRRHIKEAHEEYSVVKVEFVKGSENPWLLTSCGMDGAVRRWDTRGGTGIANSGFVGEWRGHRGEGEGGGVLGFVQGGDGQRIVTAGDDGVSLVFDTASA